MDTQRSHDNTERLQSALDAMQENGGFSIADVCETPEPTQEHRTDEQTAAEFEQDFGKQIQEQTIGVRLQRSALGRFRKLTDAQAQQQADLFHADKRYVRGRKMLFDSKHPAYKAVTACLNRAHAVWKDMTVPYPEMGVRLLKRDRIPDFEQEMNQIVDDMSDALADLDDVFRDEIVAEARERLGELYSEMDYPDSVREDFSISWDYPSLQPDPRLQQLHPELYREAQEQAQKRFEEAVRLTEAELMNALEGVITNMVDRLSPQEVHTYAYEGDDQDTLTSRLGDVDNDIARLTMKLDQTPPESAEFVYDEEYRHGGDEVDLEGLEEERTEVLSKSELLSAEAIERRGNKVLIEIPEDPEKPEGKQRKVKKTFDDSAEADHWLTSHGCRFVRTKQECKTFQKSTVENLEGFFQRFSDLNIGSSQELDKLVDQAKEAASGVTVDELRKADVDARERIRQPFAAISESLDALMIDRPKRQVRFDDEE